MTCYSLAGLFSPLSKNADFGRLKLYNTVVPLF